MAAKIFSSLMLNPFVIIPVKCPDTDSDSTVTVYMRLNLNTFEEERIAFEIHKNGDAEAQQLDPSSDLANSIISKNFGQEEKYYDCSSDSDGDPINPLDLCSEDIMFDYEDSPDDGLDLQWECESGTESPLSEVMSVYSLEVNAETNSSDEVSETIQDDELARLLLCGIENRWK